MGKKQSKEYRQNYYNENKQTILQKKKQYYQKNKEKISLRNKKYSEKNKGLIQERSKEYYAKNCKEIIRKKIIYEGKRYRNDKKYRQYCLIKRRSERKYNKYKKECINCGTSENLLLHHYTKPITLDEVMCVCKNCHYLIHNWGLM